MLPQQGYSYLGLAKRGGNIIMGVRLLPAIQKKIVYLVLTSVGVGSTQAKKYEQKCFYYHISYFRCLDFNLTQQALGMYNVKTIGIKDQHLAQRLLTLLNNS
ncbi:L7Ae/L30e/S12e/Gadd45 family ribosomal protein [Spiroplasma endosymbiont of Polydrusus formosus]|uniref:L7Ae/L30e/S12e/Gadd45 family ribosomal protein n=1 Tax=Spiroplasma endosymbiont of Polydrusus formosus TaxID=3139326 RepID=UPI0035B51CF4